MCGIAGILRLTHANQPSLRDLGQRMLQSIEHRGPDGQGIWEDKEIPIILGHRRLSIIDLSPTGHQPMVSSSGRFVIIFNGEIYNFRNMKRDLDAVSPRNWRGTSDTEVFLEMIEEQGLNKTLLQANGMFAFALYDVQEKRLTLGRDRMGEKPLYYGTFQNHFVFGSELKIIKSAFGNYPEIDEYARQLFFKYGYIPAPYCIYKDFFKLRPGHIMTIDCTRPLVYEQPQSYWHCAEGGDQGYRLSLDTAIDELDAILHQVIQEQCISDVPLGSFLSGGVDSSLVTAIMQQVNEKPVKTFSIGFEVQEHNEAHFAKKVANHIGTSHTELYVTDKEAQSVIPSLPHIYDEPFADSSQIPTFLVSKLAKQHVTVALSGDGADELFGGYSRYLHMLKIKQISNVLPRKVSGLLNRLLHAPIIPQTRVTCRAKGLFKSLSIPLNLAYEHHISIWKQIVPHNIHFADPTLSDLLLFDLHQYLPDDIMVKVDRASMANSLEARAPFLDRRVAEFALNLPFHYKINRGEGKIILKKLLLKYLPEELINRPKMGFGVPLNQWLRGPLKAWGEHLVSEFMKSDFTFFNENVLNIWQDHQNQKDNHPFKIWTILMYQAWYETEYRQ